MTFRVISGVSILQNQECLRHSKRRTTRGVAAFSRQCYISTNHFQSRLLVVPSAPHDPGKRLELPCGGGVQEDGTSVPDHVGKSTSTSQVRVQRCDAPPEEPHIGVRSPCNKLPGKCKLQVLFYPRAPCNGVAPTYSRTTFDVRGMVQKPFMLAICFYFMLQEGDVKGLNAAVLAGSDKINQVRLPCFYTRDIMHSLLALNWYKRVSRLQVIGLHVVAWAKSRVPW